MLDGPRTQNNDEVPQRKSRMDLEGEGHYPALDREESPNFMHQEIEVRPKPLYQSVQNLPLKKI